MFFSANAIDHFLVRFSKLRALVIGDLMLDEFVWGKVSRLSPEAPVPIVEVQKCSYFPGGAANVARNLLEFTKEVSVLGVVGEDEAGKKLLQSLENFGCNLRGIQIIQNRQTTQKTRIFGRQQQVVRVDRETKEPIPKEITQNILLYLEKELDSKDLIIIEDYAKGLLDQTIIDFILNHTKGKDILVAVDPHSNNRLNWTGVSVVKPNRKEAIALAGFPDVHEEDLTKIVEAARILQKKWHCSYILVTLGEEGMLLLEREGKPKTISAVSREVFDVSGAGDTAISLFSLALSAGATGFEAALIANHGAGVVVGKLGTATCTPAELKQSILSFPPTIDSRL
ncbi:D-glycero-beta-D-manno-heptose 7-phosphate kinase [Methylacidiphilum kamchatkense Kam1]|uniref:D-beta-D-heptose 7-phosphate kinase/D-beta-D-heptose 1-phosphate adenosyltransferase n=1 Tax=Methylacidiphilum kamchatkense Kam1 TaxID=1202785 RepID=A0A0C1UPP6_9BACT|nr:PfkB family carbohydrate kinase [Methylacidiphilum kamchatkense]KIE58374.1 D-glycero-beta-D-manno-heptose 7-phosphate kinase [Methylacidiphilum kamchatkense Kam1]QDQ42220.1 D-beta-D-heptose 7-phosphate kinase/D-beta-D-heptose 1-phosphate adenosyltransferase [Methylacidiphilum kamchatkense Kam1]